MKSPNLINFYVFCCEHLTENVLVKLWSDLQMKYNRQANIPNQSILNQTATRHQLCTKDEEYASNEWSKNKIPSQYGHRWASKVPSAKHIIFPRCVWIRSCTTSAQSCGRRWTNAITFLPFVSCSNSSSLWWRIKTITKHKHYSVRPSRSGKVVYSAVLWHGRSWVRNPTNACGHMICKYASKRLRCHANL